jgi:hypothetical protein
MTEAKQYTPEEAKKIYIRVYKREWARRNPEKVKAIRERFYQKKAAQLNEMTAGGYHEEKNGR